MGSVESLSVSRDGDSRGVGILLMGQCLSGRRKGVSWRSSVMGGHMGQVVSMSMNWDGTHVISKSDDGTVREWRKDGGKWS